MPISARSRARFKVHKNGPAYDLFMNYCRRSLIEGPFRLILRSDENFGLDSGLFLAVTGLVGGFLGMVFITGFRTERVTRVLCLL